MKILKILLVTCFLSTMASAGELCPVNSCNPHNNCVEGCRTFSAPGEASCENVNYEDALKAAQRASRSYAYNYCGGSIYQKSKWSVNSATKAPCSIKGSAKFWCLR